MSELVEPTLGTWPVRPMVLIANPSADVYVSDLQMLESVTALVEGGIDLVLVETLSDLAEAEAAIAAAKQVAPDLPLVVTMSFDTNLRTMMGVRPGDAVRRLAELEWRLGEAIADIVIDRYKRAHQQEAAQKKPGQCRMAQMPGDRRGMIGQ